MLGLDGCRPFSVETEKKAKGRDLREAWWRKYLAAIGEKHDPILPDFLSTEYDDYSEFGSEPLLTYLICQNALRNQKKASGTNLAHEVVNELTYTKNRNEVYREIIHHVHSRTAQQYKNKLSINRFFSVLQHMALSLIHI